MCDFDNIIDYIYNENCSQYISEYYFYNHTCFICDCDIFVPTELDDHFRCCFEDKCFVVCFECGEFVCQNCNYESCCMKCEI